MSLLLGSCIPLLLLNCFIKLLDFCLKLVLELLIHLGVLFDLLCHGLDLVLEVLARSLTLLEVC